MVPAEFAAHRRGRRVRGGEVDVVTLLIGVNVGLIVLLVVHLWVSLTAESYEDGWE